MRLRIIRMCGLVGKPLNIPIATGNKTVQAGRDKNDTAPITLRTHIFSQRIRISHDQPCMLVIAT